MSNYLNINKCATADGPGIRVSVYLAGCPLHCKGCHNPESWDPTAGSPFTIETIDEIIDLAKSPYITGLSVAGGEPLSISNVLTTHLLIKRFKQAYPDKTIWIWTGYELEELLNRTDTDRLNEIAEISNAFVVGRFILEKRDISKDNPWRGSTNQRVIDPRRSFAERKMITIQDIKNNEI